VIKLYNSRIFFFIFTQAISRAFPQETSSIAVAKRPRDASCHSLVVKNVFYVFLCFYKNMFLMFFYSVYVINIYNALTWPREP